MIKNWFRDPHPTSDCFTECKITTWEEAATSYVNVVVTKDIVAKDAPLSNRVSHFGQAVVGIPNSFCNFATISQLAHTKLICTEAQVDTKNKTNLPMFLMIQKLPDIIFFVFILGPEMRVSSCLILDSSSSASLADPVGSLSLESKSSLPSSCCGCSKDFTQFHCSRSRAKKFTE